jgi:hypothetical protein
MSIDRLLSLQAENDTAGAEMLIEGERFARIKARGKPLAVSSFNLFQTPPDIARAMVQLAAAEGHENPTVLEPSAGLGNLYRAASKQWGDSAYYTLVEESPTCCKVLYESFTNIALLQMDFLGFPAENGPGYNVIIMNPPFKQGLDIKHINHAARLLLPGGILVALCYNGVRQNEQLRPIADTWQVLPEGSFRSAGTSASVAMLTIKRRV